MRFSAGGFRETLRHLPTPWLVGGAALAWLAFISFLHYHLNFEHGDRRTVLMGYMPVITNLAAPLLDHATVHGDGLRFSARKFASFAEMGEALRNGEIQVAFMIAPLSIVLRQQGEDVKIVCIGNRHESTLVAKKSLNVKHFSDLAGKTVAVPMRFSGHNLSLRRLIEKHRLHGQINVVEMNPPDMASALATGSLDAYYVGEPFAAQTIRSGLADVVYYVEEVWKGFICNLILVRQRFIESDPEIVAALVEGAARSGLWAESHTRQAAEIAARYWNQSVDLVEYAMTTPKGRIVYDAFVPRLDEMQTMADLMVQFGLIQSGDIGGLVADRFARGADLSGITDFDSILHPPGLSQRR
jgi:NitT/TauT family transport system substrate-binding protein